MDIGDWAGNFFTGDWTNAYEESPLLTAGIPALLATGGLGAAGVGPLAGLFGGAEAGAGGLAGLFGGTEAGGAALGEAAGSGGFLESLLGGGGLEGTLGESLLTGGEGAGYIGEALGLAAPEAASSVAGDAGISAINSALASGAGSTGLPSFEAGLAAASGSAEGLGGAADLASKAAGGGDFLTGLIGGAKDSLMKNPLGAAAGALGLGSAFMSGNGQSPQQQKLQEMADRLGPQGLALQQYLTNGTLPPGLQAKLDQATQAAKARIISNHAKNGMSTDPSMNSALAQELNGVDTNAVAAMAQSQIQMMQVGLQETGLSTQLYEMLMKMDRQDNSDLMSAIANFAAAMGGSTGRKKAA